MDYFLKYIITTKSIVKLLVFINIVFVMGLCWWVLLGNVITVAQAKAGVCCLVIAILGLVFRVVALDDD